MVHLKILDDACDSTNTAEIAAVMMQDEKSAHDRKRKTKDAGFKKKSQPRRAQASIPEEDEEND
jgi:hypothetical protein